MAPLTSRQEQVGDVRTRDEEYECHCRHQNGENPGCVRDRFGVQALRPWEVSDVVLVLCCPALGEYVQLGVEVGLCHAGCEPADGPVAVRRPPAIVGPVELHR